MQGQAQVLDGVEATVCREVPGMAIGASEAETFWLDFLRRLKRRGLAGVTLVISDAHEGIKAAVPRLFRATWQRCRGYTSCATLWLMQAGAAGASCRHSSPPPSPRIMPTLPAPSGARSPTMSAPKLPKLAALLDEAEEDVLAYMSFPKEHRAKSSEAQTDALPRLWVTVHSKRASRKRSMPPERA